MPLLTEAVKYADSLSAAVVLGLRLFIDSEKEKESGNKDIELKVSSNGREIIKGSKVKEFLNLVIGLPRKGTLRRYS